MMIFPIRCICEEEEEEEEENLEGGVNKEYNGGQG